MYIDKTDTYFSFKKATYTKEIQETLIKKNYEKPKHFDK